MSQERFRSRVAVPPPAEPEATSSVGGQPSSIARQAAGFGAAAGMAYESCQRGAEAEAELEARTQESGQ